MSLSRPLLSVSTDAFCLSVPLLDLRQSVLGAVPAPAELLVLAKIYSIFPVKMIAPPTLGAQATSKGEETSV